MSSFRFLHAADIHLDSPLKGLAGQEGPAAERIRAATRDAFDTLIGTALRERVDLLIIAGDLYDGDWRDYRTGLFLVRQLGRLAEAGIPVALVHGNHDAESRITRRLTLPGTVTAFPAHRPRTLRLEPPGVALHGQSFRGPRVTEDLAAGYPEPVPGLFNIGMLHTGLGGRDGHADYAPCTLEQLVAKGYDYWALGHVHRAAVLHEAPHVVFPGNLQGRHVRETGPKGAVLVTVTDGAVAGLAAVACDTVRWARLAVPVDDVAGAEEALDRVRGALERAVAEEADGRLLACRLELHGTTVHHDALVAAEERLLAEARALALALGEEVAWVERVVVATTPPPAGAAEARPDALDALERLLADAPADAELARQLAADLGELVRRLPPEIRAEPDDPILAAAVAHDPAALIAGVAGYLKARVAGAGR